MKIFCVNAYFSKTNTLTVTSRCGLIIAPLGACEIGVPLFCGVSALVLYLREQALQDVKGLMASCFVLTETATGAIA